MKPITVEDIMRMHYPPSFKTGGKLRNKDLYKAQQLSTGGDVLTGVGAAGSAVAPILAATGVGIPIAAAVAGVSALATWGGNKINSADAKRQADSQAMPPTYMGRESYKGATFATGGKIKGKSHEAGGETGDVELADGQVINIGPQEVEGKEYLDTAAMFVYPKRYGYKDGTIDEVPQKKSLANRKQQMDSTRNALNKKASKLKRPTPEMQSTMSVLDTIDQAMKRDIQEFRQKKVYAPVLAGSATPAPLATGGPLGDKLFAAISPGLKEQFQLTDEDLELLQRSPERFRDLNPEKFADMAIWMEDNMSTDLYERADQGLRDITQGLFETPEGVVSGPPGLEGLRELVDFADWFSSPSYLDEIRKQRMIDDANELTPTSGISDINLPSVDKIEQRVLQDRKQKEMLSDRAVTRGTTMPNVNVDPLTTIPAGQIQNNAALPNFAMQPSPTQIPQWTPNNPVLPAQPPSPILYGPQNQPAVNDKTVVTTDDAPATPELDAALSQMRQNNMGMLASQIPSIISRGVDAFSPVELTTRRFVNTPIPERQIQPNQGLRELAVGQNTAMQGLRTRSPQTTLAAQSNLYGQTQAAKTGYLAQVNQANMELLGRADQMRAEQNKLNAQLAAQYDLYDAQARENKRLARQELFDSLSTAGTQYFQAENIAISDLLLKGALDKMG